MPVNFQLVSESQVVLRRDFPFADPALLNPDSVTPVPVIEGEFLELTDAYKVDRGTVNPAIIPSFAYYAEKGRSDTQAIQKGPVLYLHAYEADTKIMAPAGLLLGSALEVANVTVGGVIRRGLRLLTTGYEVGRVSRLPANNKGFLRFIRTAP